MFSPALFFPQLNPCRSQRQILVPTLFSDCYNYPWLFSFSLLSLLCAPPFIPLSSCNYLPVNIIPFIHRDSGVHDRRLFACLFSFLPPPCAFFFVLAPFLSCLFLSIQEFKTYLRSSALRSPLPFRLPSPDFPVHWFSLFFFLFLFFLRCYASFFFSLFYPAYRLHNASPRFPRQIPLPHLHPLPLLPARPLIPLPLLPLSSPVRNCLVRKISIRCFSDRLVSHLSLLETLPQWRDFRIE